MDGTPLKTMPRFKYLEIIMSIVSSVEAMIILSAEMLSVEAMVILSQNGGK